MNARDLFCSLLFIGAVLWMNIFNIQTLTWQLLHKRKVTCPTCVTLNPFRLVVYFAYYQMASVVPFQPSGHAGLWQRGCGWAWPPWCRPPEGWWRTTMGCWGHSSARAAGRTRWNAAWPTQSWRETIIVVNTVNEGALNTAIPFYKRTLFAFNLINCESWFL